MVSIRLGKPVTRTSAASATQPSARRSASQSVHRRARASTACHHHQPLQPSAARITIANRAPHGLTPSPDRRPDSAGGTREQRKWRCGELWVFGYGSLIWQPGFDFVEKRLATLTGYRRAFCMASIRYRGTPEAPGLVLALDRDAAGSCEGVAYRVPAATAERDPAPTSARASSSPTPTTRRGCRSRLDDGREVEALAYVSNPRAPAVSRRPEPRGAGRGDRPRRRPARPERRLPASTPSRAWRRSACTTPTCTGWPSWCAPAPGPGREGLAHDEVQHP